MHRLDSTLAERKNEHAIGTSIEMISMAKLLNFDHFLYVVFIKRRNDCIVHCS
jgi:hypothetical protein